MIACKDMKYMRLNHPANAYHTSMRDWIYWTLRDIYINANAYSYSLVADDLSNYLTKVESIDMTLDGEHAIFMNRLQKWFLSFRPSYFEPTSNTAPGEFMEFHTWWVQFEDLRKTIQLSSKTHLTPQV